MSSILSSELKGRPVIAVDEGARIGVVERLYLDLASGRLIGAAVDPGGSALDQVPRIMLDIDDVRTIGPDVVTVATRSAPHGQLLATYDGPLIDVDDLIGLDVLTEAGERRGTVSAIDLDLERRRLAAVHVSPGRFKPSIRLEAALLRTLGLESVIVTDQASLARDGTPSTPDEIGSQPPG
jgi:sporulation protein YlmC with PRC-barrel domain